MQMAKRLFQAKKAGHTGCLDPLATGLLPICFGEATKFSRFLLESHKCYRVVAKLGIRTDTGDCEGTIISKQTPSLVPRADLEALLQKFTGNQLQIPSMFSALKHQGQPLYKFARQGIEIERAARPVFIEKITLLDWRDNLLSLEIVVSKGTYIRTLVDDIGVALGCGAHVTDLRRTQVGSFSEREAMAFETLNAIAEENGAETLANTLLPIRNVLTNIPWITLSLDLAHLLRQGQAVHPSHSLKEGWVQLCTESHFLGIGEILADGRIAPRRLTQEGVPL